LVAFLDSLFGGMTLFWSVSECGPQHPGNEGIPPAWYPFATEYRGDRVVWWKVTCSEMKVTFIRARAGTKATFD